MKALTFSKFGSSDVLEYIEVPIPNIKANEVLLKMETIGLNYADIYRRKGNYHLKGQPPFIAGYEGAGIVVESKVESIKTGDRIAFADVPFANAEYVAVREDHIIKLPKEISTSLAASILLQGLTAQYLATDSYPVNENDIVLIHAASGGVGQTLIQYCKLKGATVIGLTRNESKLNVILENKADHAVLLDENWKSEVMKLTQGKGVSVVYDSVGSTLKDSFDVTKEKGTVVFYGMSGGDPAHVDPRMLMDTSKTLTGGDLWSYLNSKEERNNRAQELFSAIINGEIKIKDPVTFKLSEGKLAHDYLEKGSSSSKVLLIP